jgi:hypothetical protein
MPSSPLLHADLSVVQDVFLTKTTMLLSRSAEPEEWRFEYQAARTASGDRWSGQNAFLLDFTLGRLAVAVDRARSALPDRSGGFVDRFTRAIRASEGSVAREVWAAERLVHHANEDAVTVALVARLMVPLNRAEKAEVLAHIPPPFVPTQDAVGP